MKVLQILPTIAFGDAVSNDAVAMKDTLRRAGYATDIFAENIDSRLAAGVARKIDEMPRLHPDDIIIYHLSTGTPLNYKVAEFGCRKLLVYHNVTPGRFFDEYSYSARELSRNGLEGVRFLADKLDYCLADSEFNKMELINAGYQCPIDVLPILIPYSDYEKKSSEKIIRRFSADGKTNILFTGRIAPNKKQEDVIRAFGLYQKYYNQESRLFLVGSYRGMERYYGRLKNYVKELNLEKSVFFTGHIRFDEILAYYRVADLFLCMSEHEGFCVPLIESMYFHIPIVAYASSAIPDTLGGTGVLLQEKNHLEAAGVMHYLMSHTQARERVTENQDRRLEDFAHDKVERQFLEYLEAFIQQNK